MDAISCLLPPPAALLPASFADAAIARALHFTTTTTTTTMSPDPDPCCYYSPKPAGRRNQRQRQRQRHHSSNQQLAPAAGRAGTMKRRSRASKRAPTTYISTDPANFRLMVQHVTGAQQADAAGGDANVAASAAAGDHQYSVDMMMLMLMLHQATIAAAALPVPCGEEASSALRHHHHQEQPRFPTLDSWNVVMYETHSAAADML